MFSMEKSDAYKKGSASGKKWDGGGPGGPGGPYGGRPRGPPRGLDNVRGIDHSAVPACGSCCVLLCSQQSCIQIPSRKIPAVSTHRATVWPFVRANHLYGGLPIAVAEEGNSCARKKNGKEKLL
ncbi:hypothetical protein C1H46_005522 [Malus baccata]|uniref:Uncharacterized protein n=1 Tax=Malus baccata TaxID=106549 RepID=A0A540ND02_MALBA|nr:hypothetical protein C1H46_005522 [Malus baccata]